MSYIPHLLDESWLNTDLEGGKIPSIAKIELWKSLKGLMALPASVTADTPTANHWFDKKDLPSKVECEKQ